MAKNGYVVIWWLCSSYAVIRPVMTYASVIWSSCDKEQLYRVLKLQKRAARVIMNNQGLISVLLFISVLMGLNLFTEMITVL